MRNGVISTLATLSKNALPPFRHTWAEIKFPRLSSLSRGILLGSASLVAHDMDTRMDLSPWLARVYVTPEHRSRGVGTALVQRVLEETIELGVETLYLFTPDREEFYASLGWSVVERTEYRGQKVVIMAMHIMDLHIAA